MARLRFHPFVGFASLRLCFPQVRIRPRSCRSCPSFSLFFPPSPTPTVLSQHIDGRREVERERRNPLTPVSKCTRGGGPSDGRTDTPHDSRHTARGRKRWRADAPRPKQIHDGVCSCTPTGPGWTSSSLLRLPRGIEGKFSDPDEGCMRQTYEMDPPWETFQSRRTKDERCMLRVNVTHVQSNPHAEEIEPTSSTWREGNTHLCQRVDDASIEMESHLGTQPPRKTCGHCTSSRETNLCPPKAWMRRQKINFKFPKVHHSQHVQPKRAQLIQRIQ